MTKLNFIAPGVVLFLLQTGSDVPAPTFSPPAGEVNCPATITITDSAPDAVIVYAVGHYWSSSDEVRNAFKNLDARELSPRPRTLVIRTTTRISAVAVAPLDADALNPSREADLPVTALSYSMEARASYICRDVVGPQSPNSGTEPANTNLTGDREIQPTQAQQENTLEQPTSNSTGGSAAAAPHQEQIQKLSKVPGPIGNSRRTRARQTGSKQAKLPPSLSESKTVPYKLMRGPNRIGFWALLIGSALILVCLVGWSATRAPLAIPREIPVSDVRPPLRVLVCFAVFGISASCVFAGLRDFAGSNLGAVLTFGGALLAYEAVYVFCWGGTE